MNKETSYETLKRVSDIVDYKERQKAFVACLQQNPHLAVVVHRTYHPGYNWDLPEGEIPGSRASNHDEAGPFLQCIRSMDRFRITSESIQYKHLSQKLKLEQYITLYESVSTGDALLLNGIKDKKLPFDNLDLEFVVDTLPHLFPPSFRKQVKIQDNKEPSQEPTSKSKVEICREIMQNNPGLTRKEHLALFEEQGISKVTGVQYYQRIKKEI